MFGTWRDQAAEGHVAEVERWFAMTSVGPVFRAPDGNMIPVSLTEAAAIKTGAISSAIQHSGRAINRLTAVLALMIALVAGPYLIGAIFGFDVPRSYGDVLPGIMTAHALWFGYEIFDMTRTAAQLRAAIAFELRGRVPLPDTLADAVRDRNFAFPILKAIGLVLVGYYILAEIASHFGLDLVGPVSGYAVIGLTVLIPLLAIYSKRHDAARRQADARLEFDQRIADQLRRLPNTGGDLTGTARGEAAGSADAFSSR